MKKNKILFLVLSLLSWNCFFVSLSHAGVSIDKPKIRLLISPGSYDGGEIRVENTDRGPLTIKVYLEDWVYGQQDGTKAFMPKGTTALSCSSWITFYPADFTLPANGSQIVRYTVSVPKDAKGGHYSVMFFETGGGDAQRVNEQGNTVFVKILNRLGALFYTEAEGTVQKTAEIKNINLMTKLNSLVLTADFLNTGNTDITGSGSCDVLDSQGFVYSRGTIDEFFTLQKDKATLHSTLQSVNLKPGEYDMILTIDFHNGGNLVKEVGFRVSGDGTITSLTVKD